MTAELAAVIKKRQREYDKNKKGGYGERIYITELTPIIKNIITNR
jgi:hypothetical protein